MGDSTAEDGEGEEKEEGASTAKVLFAERGPGDEGLDVWRSIELIGVDRSEPAKPLLSSLICMASLRAVSSASSLRTIFSYSRSWPRKLKFGEIVGLLSFTYLDDEQMKDRGKEKL